MLFRPPPDPRRRSHWCARTSTDGIPGGTRLFSSPTQDAHTHPSARQSVTAACPTPAHGGAECSRGLAAVDAKVKAAPAVVWSRSFTPRSADPRGEPSGPRRRSPGGRLAGGLGAEEEVAAEYNMCFCPWIHRTRCDPGGGGSRASVWGFKSE